VAEHAVAIVLRRAAQCKVVMGPTFDRTQLLLVELIAFERDRVGQPPEHVLGKPRPQLGGNARLVQHVESRGIELRERRAATREPTVVRRHARRLIFAEQSAAGEQIVAGLVPTSGQGLQQRAGKIGIEVGGRELESRLHSFNSPSISCSESGDSVKAESASQTSNT